LLPLFYLSVNEIFVGGKKVLHAFVPVSSQVHRCKQKIFIRDGSSDRDITDRNHEVSNLGLYIGKGTSYSENRIFLVVKFRDLIAKAKN